MLFTVHHGRAQEQPAGEEEDERQSETSENKPGEADEEELKPEVFIPTDELSEDKDIAFPTNI